MPLTYRNVTGPVHDAQGNVLASGTLQVKLRAPLVDGDTFISPVLLETTITAGAFTIQLAAPGNYDFTVVDTTNNTLWSFQAPLDDDVDTDISLAELFLSQGESVDITTVITQLIALLDTPASYTGHAGKALVVNATEDGIEFV